MNHHEYCVDTYFAILLYNIMIYIDIHNIHSHTSRILICYFLHTKLNMNIEYAMKYAV